MNTKKNPQSWLTIGPQIDKMTARIKQLESALKAVVDADGGLDRYDHEEDEVGCRSCCGVVSYKEHEADCYVVIAKKALEDTP